jgi:hypothetical protein
MPRRRRPVPAILAAVLLAGAAAPAQADPPTRLWYSAKITYKYDGVYDETRVDRLGAVHVTENVEWQVHTDKGEAPLVRRNRRTGRIGVAVAGGAAVVGKIRRVDGVRTASWDPNAPNTYLRGCSPSMDTVRSKLTTNPEMSGLFTLSGGSLITLLTANPHAQQVNETGTITCAPQCPFGLPGSTRSPVEHPDGSCHFDPHQPFDHNAQWELPSHNTVAIGNQLRPQHEKDFVVKRGFGDRKITVTSVAKAEWESTLSDPARTTKETATETITLDFIRCPHAGRRSC